MYPQGGDGIPPFRDQSSVSFKVGHSDHSFHCTLCSESTKPLKMALSYMFKTPYFLSFSVSKPDTDSVALPFPSDHDLSTSSFLISCIFLLNT